jgi:hypothetical protein
MPQATPVTLVTRQEATVKISTRQDVVVDSNARQSATVIRRISVDVPPVVVVFSGYAIKATTGGVRITWLTDTPISTKWMWGEDGGEGIVYTGPFWPLKTSHYAAITWDFEIGTTYEFQAYGYDAANVLHEDAVKHFHRHAPPETEYEVA